MNSIWYFALLGAGAGALLGYFNRRKTEAFPFTANWWRGAISGALLASFFCFVSGCGGDSAAMNKSTANVIHISDAEFETNVMQSSQPVVVDCYATWCGPCKMLSPIVDKVADAYAGKIKFYKVNVDESPKVSQKFQIQAIPTLLFFKDGKLSGTTVGLLTKADLALRVDDLLDTTDQPAAVGR